MKRVVKKVLQKYGQYTRYLSCNGNAIDVKQCRPTWLGDSGEALGTSIGTPVKRNPGWDQNQFWYQNLKWLIVCICLVVYLNFLQPLRNLCGFQMNSNDIMNLKQKHSPPHRAGLNVSLQNWPHSLILDRKPLVVLNPKNLFSYDALLRDFLV